jgi:Cof subfamily protein (haloacid dehalogenase superfamily)
LVELVCIDVDGTLVGSSGRVAPEVWDAAERARAAGLRLAICSGRPAFGLTREYAERLDPVGWHVFQNGASILHLGSGRSASRCLPAEAVDALVARARRAGRVLELYDDAEYAVESTDERAVRHAGLLGVPFAPRPFDSLRRAIVRAQWVVALRDEAAVVAEQAEGLAVSPSTSPVMADTCFVNLMAPGVDKAGGVRAVAAEYGVPLSRVMMIGDGANDLEAMRIAGIPVAMGNAEPEILALAAHRVAHVDRGGLVQALELAVRLRGEGGGG